MQVSKWGNSLAVRLPAVVVEALDLKEGDEIEISIAGKRDFIRRSLIPTSSYMPFTKTTPAVKWPKLCWLREEHYQFRFLTSSSLWRGASLTRVGRTFAAPSTYFASFVQSPCLLRSRPTREPCTLPSDTGIQSLIHSSSRLRSLLARAHFIRRTCETVRQSMGLQSAIHFRARHTDPTG